MRSEDLNAGSEGQASIAEKANRDAPMLPAPQAEEEGLGGRAAKAAPASPFSSAPSVAALVAVIRAAHRRRCYAMKARKSIDNQLGGYLRHDLGWTREHPERVAIAKRAQDLIAYGEAMLAKSVGHARQSAATRAARKFDTLTADMTADMAAAWAIHRDLIVATLISREKFDAIEASATAQMRAAAEQLPLFVALADGAAIGALSLAIIVGEAGDLGSYRNKSCLWKRMGVAVIDGKRQGAPGEGATKADWIEHGYSKPRRSRLYTVGDALIKQQGRYREIYLARKAVEIAMATAEGLIVAPSARIPKKRAAEFISDGHIHRRAQRYMEKKLLAHLRAAWRAESPEEAHGGAGAHVGRRPIAPACGAAEHRAA